MLKDCFTPYKSVELGFPSEEDELIMEYAQDEDYTNTVYGQVPVETVEKLIDKHGGYLETATKKEQNEQEEN